MSDDTSGGLGIVWILLLIAIAAALLGYSQIASVAFWAALGVLGVLLVLVIVVVVIILLAWVVVG